MGEALALMLLYGCQAQAELNGGESTPFDTAATLAKARELARPGNPSALLDFCLQLELLTPRWETILRNPKPARWTDAHRALAQYLIRHY